MFDLEVRPCYYATMLLCYILHRFAVHIDGSTKAVLLKARNLKSLVTAGDEASSNNELAAMVKKLGEAPTGQLANLEPVLRSSHGTDVLPPQESILASLIPVRLPAQSAPIVTAHILIHFHSRLTSSPYACFALAGCV